MCGFCRSILRLAKDWAIFLPMPKEPLIKEPVRYAHAVTAISWQASPLAEPTPPSGKGGGSLWRLVAVVPCAKVDGCLAYWERACP